MTNRPSSETGARPGVGMLEWFQTGDRATAEALVADLRRLGVERLRFGVSWADFFGDGGPDWYDWLIPELARHFDLLPCFSYTPPSLGETPSTASPPRDLRAYADFIDQCITRYGAHFEYVELWNEPNNVLEWNYALDSSWTKFCEMIGAAANWARQRGKKTVLGGVSPIDPNWVRVMFRNGLMPYIDVVGVHAFPGSYDVCGDSCHDQIQRVIDVLREEGHPGEVWLTETGYSTWRHDEFAQVDLAAGIQDLPVGRIYWLTLRDLAGDRPSMAGLHNDPRDYHFGIQDQHGRPKLLYRLWSDGGLDAVRAAARWPTRAPSREPFTLVTGGAGFVGSNLVSRLAREGRRVRIVDNLARPGVEKNLEWLRSQHGEAIEFVPCDLRDRHVLNHAVEGATQIFHLAGQVAVTTSLEDPISDFEINLAGSVNVLEAARRQKQVPGVVFASTNKVYGGLEDVALEVADRRYQPVDPAYLHHGVGEHRPLDFHSPYGCSKGGADQYIIDYARCMGVPSVVFRMSCIYGPRQFGTEDQGWVAHFLIRAMRGEPITLYGDGMQVRDILHVDDLLDAYLLAEKNLARFSGRVFNMGGGPANTISLLQLLDWIAELEGRKPEVDFGGWRPGDQRYYVSDTRRFTEASGWRARIAARDGVADLHRWLRDSYVVPVAARPAAPAPVELACASNA
ncbi:NAD-dependent epimerase/dehydratase family protein [Coralloluteibacterium stylophorae]|uniref:NAD-dependent epimerase/dehydratase family protein n=1 Tax=Coralloluteibacterium stylophorae TaxID=1776034 RepID=A0AAP2C9U6_9GAMM|nr:NAD-dependent epimerase/dehydratase family protein [Coralloluteibacterium stylophorae]MBS7456276.1 NAD-dependent epimerase/dehydratase family protein [Coralloluteibacterium stylophorae]